MWNTGQQVAGGEVVGVSNDPAIVHAWLGIEVLDLDENGFKFRSYRFCEKEIHVEDLDDNEE